MRSLIRSSLALAVGLAPALAVAAPALDGHAQGIACAAASPTATLTTSGPGVVIALAGNEDASVTTPAPPMTVSGAGLSWVKLSDQNKIGDGGISTVCPTVGCSLNTFLYKSVWYAVSAGALAAQAITAAVSASTDASGLTVFGISGSDTTTVADPAQPCSAIEDPYATLTGLPGVYTNATNPFQIVEAITANLDSVSAAPAGFTDIEYVANASCSVHYYIERSSYQVYAAALTNATFTWTGSAGLAGHVFSSTAICGAAGGCTGAVRSTCPGHPAAAASGAVQFQTPISYQGEKIKARLQ